MIMFLFVIWSGHLSQLLNLARMPSNGSSPEAQALYSVREAFVWSVSGVFCGLILLLATFGESDALSFCVDLQRLLFIDP